MASRKIGRHPAKRPGGARPNRPPAPQPGTSASPRWLAAADASALILFVLSGMRSHDEGTVFAAFLRNALPLLGAWFGFAAVFGTYRRPGRGIVLRTWIVAVPAGLVVRTLWVGSPQGARFVVFLGVGLAFTLIFLLAGRAVLSVAVGRGYPDRHGS